jgi:nucleoside-diphosphate-sugar epimerase
VTVLVTGGSGLVGSHVIEALRAQGIAVRALTRHPAAPAVRALGAEVVTGDVTDPAAWQRAAQGGLAAIVHAAAIVQQPTAPLAGYEAVNVGGTRLAVETARATRARLVQVSSVAVYGGSSDYRPQPERRTEEYPFRPLDEQDFYARTKRASEALVQEAALRGDIEAIAIRPNVIYGERDRYFTHRLVRAIRGRLVPQIGPGTNHLSCVYAGNVATAILAALRRTRPPGEPFRAYNITADAPPQLTARQFLEAIADACGVRVRFVPLPLPVARVAIGLWSGPAMAGRALSFVTGENPYTIDRARAELDWTPPVTTREALTRTIRWVLANEKPG